MMKLKSPTEPIVISEESSDWLEKMLENNKYRKKLTKKEQKLLNGSKCFDEQVKSLE